MSNEGLQDRAEISSRPQQLLGGTKSTRGIVHNIRTSPPEYISLRIQVVLVVLEQSQNKKRLLLVLALSKRTKVLKKICFIRLK